MAIGFLTVQARTAQEAVPLSGVQVSILDALGSRIYEMTTDENGEVQAVPLETLDRSFSQNQYFSGTPFISYSLLAQADGFDTL